jgi:hypothetical protein
MSNLVINPASAPAALKAIKAGEAKFSMIDREWIGVIPDFNPRERDAHYHARVAWLAEQMVMHGFLREHPIVGIINKEEDGNHFYVIHGHRRLEAVDLANKKLPPEKQISQIPFLVKPNASLADLIAEVVTDNEGDPLRPFERATQVKRLLDLPMNGSTEKHTPEVVAGMIGVTPRYMQELLVLTTVPNEVRILVQQGLLSATLAIKEKRKAGADDALLIARVQAGFEAAKAAGKDVITAAHLSSRRVAAVTRPKSEDAPGRIVLPQIYIALMKYATSIDELTEGMGMAFLKAFLAGDAAAIVTAEKTVKIKAGELSKLIDGKTKSAKIVVPKGKSKTELKAAEKLASAPTGEAPKRKRRSKAEVAAAKANGAGVAPAADAGATGPAATTTTAGPTDDQVADL